MNRQLKDGKYLYAATQKCCGCGACAVVCPKNAITMKLDDRGFRYPSVDNELCVGCGMCIKACAFGKSQKFQPKECYAGANENIVQRKMSTSAGIFSAVATAFLNNGGVVCGAAMDIVNGQADVRHIMIGTIEELPRLQGSKYVQSSAEGCYPAIKSSLEEGKKVLFSGTPCQVAAVKNIFVKYAANLFTIDIICHGVPSQKFFNDYLAYIGKKSMKTVAEYQFRNKRRGWGLDGSIKFVGDNQERYFKPEEESYYKLFLNGETYRDSCYACPYAKQQRVGDLTIGDYWGAQKFSPELMAENGGPFNSDEGVSCILENTVAGRELLALAQEYLTVRKISIDKVLIINSQLREPASHTGMRDKVFSKYKKLGYEGVAQMYQAWKRKNDFIAGCKRLMPRKLKSAIKTMLKK